MRRVDSIVRSFIRREFRIRSFYSGLLLLLLSGVVAPSLSAQQPKVLAPHRPLGTRIEKRLPWGKPIVRQSATGGLWMIDANRKATLNLTNGLKADSITVTPILYLSNGQRYPLSPITLEASGTAIVDIGQALEKQGIAPYATLYGYAEIEYQWPWAAVSATIKNVDVLNSVIFIFGLQPSPEWHAEQKQWRLEHKGSVSETLPASFEGLWWKQEKDVSAFLALSNVTGQAIHATVRLTGKGDVQLASYDVTISPQGTKMLTLEDLKTSTSDTGGIYVTHDGPEGGLDINGGLLDEAVGYSARLSLRPQPSSSQPQSLQVLSVSELGLMTGAADPMMNFPSGTVFTPYSLVRNISDQTAEITPELWWMANGSAQSATLPKMTILPHQTANLNVLDLLGAAGLKNFSGSVNLILNTKTDGGLVFSSGSVDHKNTYVFEVVAHGIAEGAAKEICYWSTGNGDDTMVTLWNAADEPQDLAFTMFFSGGQYVYPIHLGPRETRTLNVSEILHSSIPDAAGNVVPAGISEGSAEIAGALAEHQHILISLDVAVYNVRKATCGTVCWECDGVVSGAIALNPFGVAVSGTTGETFYETWNTGSQHSTSASWRSSNTSVATVNSSSGVVTGVRTGSLTLTATDPYTETAGVGWYCTDVNFFCPTQNFQGSGGGTSQTAPTVTFSSIGNVAVGQNATTTATVSSGNTIPISLSISPTSAAAIVSPTGTFTGTTSVVVRGLATGTATLTATISNADGSKRTVGTTSFQVVPPPPVIQSITPQGLVGTAVPVTITGSGFAQGATIQAGTSITVSNVSVSSSTTITATFTIQNSVDAGGSWNVTVTSSGQTSNSKAFFVQIPTSLSVLSVNTIANGTQYGCTNTEYGIHIDARYQVRDQNAAAIQFAAMIPEENVNGSGWVDIGPDAVMTTSFTDSDGTYHDAPVGICNAAAFSTTVTQAVRIEVNGGFYSVRTNSFTMSGSSSGHGSINNGSDINKTR